MGQVGQVQLVMPRRHPVRGAFSSSSLVVSLLALLRVAALVGPQAAAAAAAAAAEPVPVRVGVILDWAAPASLRLRTGIEMAVEDYYAAHPRSATRVELHFRDSKGDVVGAASAAVDLIKNVQVQAIIGPKTSAEAEFVAHLGSRAHVPVLSYEATSPSLSPAQTPYFVRTAANDSFQAIPVATVLASFEWHAVAVMHEESPYGFGILPALADALQSIGDAAIVDRTAVSSGANDDALDAILYRLKAMPTRVFVVHATHGLASRLFRRAREAGMMSDGYVWVATDGIHDRPGDRLSAEDVGAMQGVVSLRPHVELTNRVMNFSARFRARFRRDNPGSDDYILNDPTVMRLWAYDTAWAIAAAAEAACVSGPAFQTPQEHQSNRTHTDLERLGVSATGSALLRAVLNTTFDGMAGRFKLVDGQLQVAAYEVVNIIGNGARTVGFWTPKSGLSRDLNGGGGKAAARLKPILWPGETLSPPRGWTASQNGRVLKVAVPVKHGFKQFVNVENSTTKITGYCIDVFDEVMRNLPYPVSYTYVPFNDSSGSYDKLVDQVSEGKADIVVGDVTITASRMDKVDYTMPFTKSGWSMVVAARPDTSASMWIFLEPLTTSLWLASLAFFCFTGFVVWVIEHRVNPEFRGTPSQQFGLIFYFAFSTLVFSHKEKLESNLSRTVVTIWVFVVLILTSSYTASLTSMLTVQQLRPTVTDVKELQRRGQYIGYQEGSFIEPFLIKMGFDERKMKKYSSGAQYAEALSKGSANGGVDAVFDEIPYLKLFLSRHCEGYMQVGPVYKTDGFGFVFPRGSPMVADVSREILRLAEEDKMARIERAWFGEPGACQSPLGGGGVSGGSSNLSLRSFGGLFLVTGVVSSLMLLLDLAIFAYRERDQLRAAEAEACSGSVSVRRLRAWLQHYDRKDLQSPAFKTWNDESVRNDSDSAGRTPRWDAGGGGGDASQAPTAREGEHAMGGTSPLSVCVSSEMNAESSPEGTPASEISESFEQRIEKAASSVMGRPTASELQE